MLNFRDKVKVTLLAKDGPSVSVQSPTARDARNTFNNYVDWLCKMNADGWKAARLVGNSHVSFEGAGTVWFDTSAHRRDGVTIYETWFDELDVLRRVRQWERQIEELKEQDV